MFISLVFLSILLLMRIPFLRFEFDFFVSEVCAIKQLNIAKNLFCQFIYYIAVNIEFDHFCVHIHTIEG
jgi:hypothetical protein